MKKLKKLKPIHKILILILIAISLTTLFIYSWYNKSSQWDNVNFNNKLADIPSEFVSDNRSLELEHDLDEFKKLENEIKYIQKNNKKSKTINDTLNTTEDLIKKYKLKNGNVVNDYEKLKLYNNIFDFKNTAYENIDSKKLNELYSSLTKQYLNTNNDYDKVLLNDLKSIIDDYNKLSTLINKIYEFGDLKNNTLLVNTDVYNFDMLNFNELNKFKYITSLEQLFKHNSVISNNNLLKEELSWDNFKKEIRLTNKNNYLQVKSLKIYKNIKNKNFKIKYLNEQNEEEDRLNNEVYDIDDESEIKKIIYKNDIIPNSYYIKPSNDIIIYIKPKYTKKDKENEKIVRIRENDD